MFKHEGGTFSSGNLVLMQRERGKKRDKNKKAKVRAVGKVGGTETGMGRRVAVQSRAAV